LGGVGGGFVPLSTERRRPLRKAFQGDNLWEGAKDPFPTNPEMTKHIISSSRA